jgi:hypothetical protein
MLAQCLDGRARGDRRGFGLKGAFDDRKDTQRGFASAWADFFH